LDLALTTIFFIGAVLAAGGALAAALAPAASWRLPGLLAAAVGTAGTLLSLSAPLAAFVALLCLPTAAMVACRAETSVVDAARPARLARASGDLSLLAGIAAAVLLVAVLLVIAFAGTFVGGGTSDFDPAAVGRAFFGRDAVAVQAVGATVMLGLAFGAIGRARRR
jgi:hypothetical protein